MTRKLSLKRESLHELTPGELTGVVGGGTTEFSCMTFVSCNPLHCVTRPTMATCVYSIPDCVIQ